MKKGEQLLTNYVKFRRGTSEAFKALGTRVEQDTLYFIFDPEKSTADLYLGSKLISSGDNDLNNLPEMNLGDLKDVSLADPISSSDVLVYNEQPKHWENRALEDLLETYNPTTSVKVDEASIESVNGQLQLKDFGTGYFAYVPAVKDEQTGEIKTPSTYEYTEGFKTGLEIRVVPTSDNKWALAWYEPGTETVEDIAANIEDISKNINTLDQVINGEGGLSNKIDSVSASMEEIEIVLSSKANSADVYTKNQVDLAITEITNSIYTKTETDTAIGEAIAAAGHLKRKKLNSGETIDVTAEDADQYIYMIPTGLTEDDDKYDEYMVIDGIVEKVGSWEVNLSNYATISSVEQLLSQKVDKKDGERLITEAEAIKLSILKEDAEPNFINSVNTNQLTVENKQLSIKAVDMNIVTNLTNALSQKANVTDVTDIATLLNTKQASNEARLAAIEGRLTWAPLEDEIV